MTNSNSTEAFAGIITMNPGEWKYIPSEPFFAPFKNKTLVWTSIDPNIVQVNPHSGLLYAGNVGSTTVFATDLDDTTVQVLCSIKVEVAEGSLETQNISGQSTTTMSTRSCDDGCSDNDSGTGNVSSLGYSGTTFAYKIVGSRVTLEKGFGSKNGTSNTYSDLFRFKLVEMNNIYASMSPTQRAVWMGLNLGGLISTIKDLLKGNYEKLAKDYIKDIMIQNALNLDELEATVLGLRRWYTVEDNAVSYYEAF